MLNSETIKISTRHYFEYFSNSKIGKRKTFRRYFTYTQIHNCLHVHRTRRISW